MAHCPWNQAETLTNLWKCLTTNFRPRIDKFNRLKTLTLNLVRLNASNCVKLISIFLSSFSWKWRNFCSIRRIYSVTQVLKHPSVMGIVDDWWPTSSQSLEKIFDWIRLTRRELWKNSISMSSHSISKPSISTVRCEISDGPKAEMSTTYLTSDRFSWKVNKTRVYRGSFQRFCLFSFQGWLQWYLPVGPKLL